jgi:hypothetical protein
MNRKRISILMIVLACLAMSGSVTAATNRYYTAVISPNNVPPGGLPTNFNLVVTNNILSGPSHFLRQIIVTVPAGFTIAGPVTVQAPLAAPLPWKATVSGNKITVISGSSSDASVTAGQSVTITVPAIAPSLNCPGGSYTWGLSANQAIGGGNGNSYLPTPGSQTPTVTVGCDTQTNLTLDVNPPAIMTTDALALVTFTSTLTKQSDGTPVAGKTVTFFVGGNPVACLGGPSTTDGSGNANCSYYPQSAPNTPLPSGLYDCLASFGGDASTTPHLGSSNAGPVKLNVNSTGTGLEVVAISVPYSSVPQSITLSATLTANGSIPVVGRTVSFNLGSTPVGNATTSASGLATLDMMLPVMAPGEIEQYIKASFAGDGTYSAAVGDAPLTVGPIPAAISFDPDSMTKTYTGDPLSPSVVTNPPGLSYSVTGFPQTNAGTYLVSATITDPSYSGTTGSQTFTINKATAVITIAQYNVTYDGNPHSVAFATALGVKGEDLSAGLSLNTTHTAAGTYSDSWTFNGGINYQSASGTIQNVIEKASSFVTMTGGTFVYDTLAHAATGVAGTSVGSLTNPSAVTITYSGSCSLAPVTVPEGTTCTATGTYLGDANHNGSSDTATVTITPASSYVTVNGGTFTYDGTAHPATAVAATSVGSLSNPSAVVISYSGSCLVAPTTVAEGASCTATGTYSGDANHSGSSNSAAIVIVKADQTIAFTSMIITATSTSGLAPSMTSGTPAICSVVPVAPGQALVTLNAGTWSQCSVLADQAGNDDVNPAEQAKAVLTTP